MSDQPDNSEPDVNQLAKSIVDRATEESPAPAEDEPSEDGADHVKSDC